MPHEMNRYKHPVIAEHLASQYVLGTLSLSVIRRIDTLRRHSIGDELNERIRFWEHKMAPLDSDVTPVAPKVETWQAIEQQINGTSTEAARLSSTQFKWTNSLTFLRWVSALSLLIVTVLLFQFTVQSPVNDEISYLAVLEDDSRTPTVVAATYGQSQTLMLDILSLPKVDDSESFELWVTSKTDRQTRSLGLIPVNAKGFTRALTTAEWRLIKDSESLQITIEEMGGSPLGEPMGTLVSKGVCIRLSGWEENS